jgi:hypothetical protein
MPQVLLDWEKISKTILEKVFIFIFSGLFLIFYLLSKYLKNGPLRGEVFFLEIGNIGYKKSRILC